ncbi:HK97 family phage prohead protease [Candidatus Pacearchaeota archaeon]|jgi:hypothetical protein|nr:HK97 family phage prohead protease [Candidatus Pacearchaeota archaeon]
MMEKRDLDVNKIETRTFALGEDFEIRSEADPKIKGHAAVFDKWSEDLGGFKERIAPGAFTKTLGESDVRMLWDHNSQYVLGRKSAGTLQLLEDSQGLYFENIPPETSWYSDLSVSMKRGDVSQMSFGFQVVRDEWNQDYTKRTVHEVRLLEISVVTFPAYPGTSAKVRSLPNGTTLDRLAELVDKRTKNEELDEKETAEIRSIAEFFKIEDKAAPSQDTPLDDVPARATHCRNLTEEIEALRIVSL